jgi:uncharacterized protein YndB with AHSA1/START domain
MKMQVVIAAPLEVVFQALTDSAALSVWFAEYADISLSEKRYDFWGRLTPETPNREQGRHPLLEFELNHRLKFGWHVREVDSIIEFRVNPQAEGTVVLLTIMDIPAANDIYVYTFEDFWFLSLDNLRRYVDGRTVVARCDFSKPMVGNIQHEIEIDGSPEQVFEALIEPEQLNRWIASQAVVEPYIGGRYDFGWPENSGALKILEIIPDKKLACLWPENQRESIVTWSLAGSGGKTRLTLVHSGFAPEEPTGGLKAGWLNYISRIKSLVEYGLAWQPPRMVLPEHMIGYYAAPIGQARSETSS